MARGIDTKCIHLEEDEGQCSHYGALSYPIYQTLEEHAMIAYIFLHDHLVYFHPTKYNVSF